MFAIINRLEATGELDSFYSHVVFEKQVVGRGSKEAVVFVRTDEIWEFSVFIQENRDIEGLVVNLDKARYRSA